MESSNFEHISPDRLREKILEEDKRKRHRVIFFSCLIIIFLATLITFLAFKKNLMKDTTFINNIDLLSNNEEINFYKKIEFYEWLEQEH